MWSVLRGYLARSTISEGMHALDEWQGFGNSNVGNGVDRYSL
jgi:hypothetical protein